MAIKQKPRKPPSNLFQKKVIKSMFFHWKKSQFGATMSTLLFMVLKMGNFQNILYLSNHICDINYL